MDQCKRYLRAVAGATVALALVIGPGAVATADPGGRGSHSGHSDRRDDSGRRGGEGSRPGASSNDSRSGTARTSRTGPATTDQRAARAGSTAPAATARGTAAEAADDSARPSSTAADEAPPRRSAPPANTDGVYGWRGTDQAEPTPERTPRFTAPVPDTPGPERAAPRSIPRAAAVTAAVETTQPAVAPPAPPPPPKTAGLRIVQMKLPVLPPGPDPRPGQPMSSLFGILGLLLIPLAGAALGYRQARAARSVGALPRT